MGEWRGAKCAQPTKTDTYPEALSTDGHRYYLSPDEVVAITELVGSNVVVVRNAGHVYRIIDYHLGCAGPWL